MAVGGGGAGRWAGQVEEEGSEEGKAGQIKAS